MKDPAFLFYPNDYIGGTMGMTFTQKGAYMEILMMQFNTGHMEGHMIGQLVGQLWDGIKKKFIQDDNGLWYNERLEIEQNKRKAYVASRSNNLEGKNQYSEKENIIGHMTDHMEDRDRNENKDKNKSDNKVLMMPFSTLRFNETWENWKQYKLKEHKFTYKSVISEQAALMKLIKLADGKEDVSIDIISESMGNKWKGLYKLPINFNNKNNNHAEKTANAVNEVISKLQSNEDQ